MGRLLAGIGGVLVALCLSAEGVMAQARPAGMVTLGDMDEIFRRASSSAVQQENSWTFFAWGAMEGGKAVGMGCERSFLTAELAAYLRYRADRSGPPSRAFEAYFRDHDCRAEVPAATQDELVERGEARAARLLLIVRESDDPAWLRGAVRDAEQPGATAMEKAMGVVAGARLLELKGQGSRTPVIRPPAPGVK